MDSADGVREGIVRGTWRHRIFSKYSPRQPNRAIHDIRGIEPLVQDALQVQPVFSLDYSHVGAVRNTPIEQRIVILLMQVIKCVNGSNKGKRVAHREKLLQNKGGRGEWRYADPSRMIM